MEEIVRACERARRPPTAPGFVVVYDLSRFSRLGSQAVFYSLQRLSDAGWQFRDTTLRLTGNAMADSIQLVVACEVAAEHSRMLKRKVPPGQRARALRGLWGGGKPPFGYVVRAGKLAPGDAADVALVKDVFRRYASGASLSELAALTGWRTTVVRVILANPAYAGTLAWGGRRPSNLATPLDPVRIEGAHPALVDRRTFDAVQRRLAGNSRHRPSSGYALTGVLRCACGDPMHGGGGVPTDADPARAARLRHYRCRGAVRVPRTCHERVNAAWVEDTITRLVVGHARGLLADGRLDRLIDRALGIEAAAAPAPDRDALDRRRQTLERQKARLIDAVARGVLSDADAKGKLAQLRAELARLGQDADAAGAQRQALAARRAELRRRATDLVTTVKGAAPGLELLRPWVEAAVIDRARGELVVTTRRLPTAIHDSTPGPSGR